jgi:hypothetical protein
MLEFRSTSDVSDVAAAVAAYEEPKSPAVKREAEEDWKAQVRRP